MKSKRTLRPQPVPSAVKPCSPAELDWQRQQLELAIARRAYELFENRNREHGHDWEDWFRAESELLRPDRISVRANLLGFGASELQVSVEPTRILILGTKHVPLEIGSTLGSNWYPDQVLRSVDLPRPVNVKAAEIEFDSGVLKFELPTQVTTAAPSTMGARA